MKYQSNWRCWFLDATRIYSSFSYLHLTKKFPIIRCWNIAIITNSNQSSKRVIPNGFGNGGRWLLTLSLSLLSKFSIAVGFVVLTFIGLLLRRLGDEGADGSRHSKRNSIWKMLNDSESAKKGSILLLLSSFCSRSCGSKSYTGTQPPPTRVWLTPSIT